MYSVKVTTVGNSVGIVLPKELVEKLRIAKGDVLQVLETRDGLNLTPYDDGFAEELEVAERVMRKRRNLLRKLAE